jgi:hypothetical protein
MTEHIHQRWHGNSADLIGQEFGRLVVVSRAGSRNGHATWFCRCDCLGSKVVTTQALLSGATRSCGCLQREHGYRIMATLPKWRGKLLALPRYENDPAAVDDHSGLPPLLLGDSYTVVFRPDAKILKGPPGRPRLPTAEVARRAAAKKPCGRPKYTGTHGERVQNECERLIRDAGLRWEREAVRQSRSTAPEPDCHEAAVPTPEPAAPDAWTRLPWRERKAAIWERARAA